VNTHVLQFLINLFINAHRFSGGEHQIKLAKDCCASKFIAHDEKNTNFHEVSDVNLSIPQTII
jgi:hypothetical protein